VGTVAPRTTARPEGVSGPLLLNALKQLKNSHPESVGNNLDGVERGVGLTVLNATQVCLVETALFAEHNLTHSGSETEFSHA
jgi:hypothetical protein